MQIANRKSQIGNGILPDLIFVSMEDWDEIWRRNQFVCAELMRRNPGMKILFVGLPRDLSHDLRTGGTGWRRRGSWRQEMREGEGGRGGDAGTRGHGEGEKGRGGDSEKRNCGLRIADCGLESAISNQQSAMSASVLSPPSSALSPSSPFSIQQSSFSNISSSLLVLHPWKLLPNTLTPGRKLNEWLMRRQVKRAAKRMGIHRPLLWLNPHYAVHMVGRMGECGVVYDITDDWTNLKQRPWLTKLIKRQDAELCRRADAVIVCSKRLLDMKRGMAANLHLIPNGVDAEHYRTVLDGTGELPEIARGWKKPVLGYTGTIHPDRVDVGLVEGIARRMPEATIVMIGPVLLGAADLSRLQSCGNVVVAGPVAYREIPNHMRAFDVCITPHCRSEFTESLNPIKLWEYLAAGKPIVSTDVAGFRDYPKLVRIANGADGFVEACKEALKEDGELAAARRAEAGRHSWGKRVEEIEGVLRGILLNAEWEGTKARRDEGTEGEKKYC